MKGNRLIVIVVAVVLTLLLLSFSTTYSVPFYEVAVVTKFGKAEGAESVQATPGLHFKLPAPIQSARLYDTRLQLVDTRLETQATKDGRQVLVQGFVFWKVNDETPDGVLSFDKTFGSLQKASEDIEARMRSAVSALSEFDFNDLIGPNNRIEEAEQRIAERLVAADENVRGLADLGIKIEKVGLSQVMVPVETTKAVIARMKQVRDIRAEAARTEGESQATRIISQGTADAQKILAFADRLANQIRGQGDTLAANVIAELSEEPELSKLLIWLDALEQTTAHNSTFFIPTTIAPFHLLDPNAQTNGNGTLAPPEELRSADQLQRISSVKPAANDISADADASRVEGN